jgi:O-acetyl-ADP-ribose deacetylase
MAEVGPRLRIVQGDITKLDVFAIVNAANSALAGGGGVDGAIHRAAGPELAIASRALAPCKTGDAKITPGFRLKAAHVIHTVGPVWQGGDRGERELLARCYRRSLALAEGVRAPSAAFPAIATGIYGFPLEEACVIAVRECRAWVAGHEWPGEVVFCMFDAAGVKAMEAAF